MARTVDDILTEVTAAPTTRAARAIMDGIRSRDGLEAMADQLYIEYVSVGSDTLRKRIVAEARA
jgi:hypothetical protein